MEEEIDDEDTGAGEYHLMNTVACSTKLSQLAISNSA